MVPLADMAPGAILAIAAIYLVSGLVKGALGFGLPLVAAVLLSLFQPVEMALALNAVVILLTNLEQLRQAKAAGPGIRAAWPMMLGMAAMVPVGAYFTAAISPRALMAVLGVFAVAFVVSNFLRPSLRIPPGWEVRIGLGLGLLSGFVGALTSAPGAIFVAYVVALHLARPAYMAALGCIMASFGLVLTLSYASVGLLSWDHVLLGLICAVPGALGMWVGNAWGRRLPAQFFRQAVLALLGVLGLVVLYRGLA